MLPKVIMNWARGKETTMETNTKMVRFDRKRLV